MRFAYFALLFVYWYSIEIRITTPLLIEFLHFLQMMLAGTSAAAHAIDLLFEVENLDIIEAGDQLCIRIIWLRRRHERHWLAE